MSEQPKKDKSQISNIDMTKFQKRIPANMPPLPLSERSDSEMHDGEEKQHTVVSPVTPGEDVHLYGDDDTENVPLKAATNTVTQETENVISSKIGKKKSKGKKHAKEDEEDSVEKVIPTRQVSEYFAECGVCEKRFNIQSPRCKHCFAINTLVDEIKHQQHIESGKKDKTCNLCCVIQ